MVLAAIILVAIALTFLYYHATSHYGYWKKHGVQSPTRPTIASVFKATFTMRRETAWADFAPNEPYVGFINLRSLSVSIRDADLVRLVLSKDFAHFHDRGMPLNEKRNPLGAHLFNLEGRKWKILRAKLTPTFTSGKLRGMFPHMKYCADQMIAILSTYADKPESLDLNDTLSRFTTDVILSCAFGLKGNSMKDPDDIYLKMVKLNFKNSLFRRWGFLLFRLFPSLEKWVPLGKHQKMVTKFFLSTFKSTVQAREQSGEKRNDFLDLLMEIKKNGRLSDGNVDEDALDTSLEFTETLMTAQAFVFFVAGSETSSGTSSSAIVELANNIDIQDKLRAEIDRVLERHGSLTYEAIMEMTYLDQVVSETLRKYPPVDTLIRITNKAYPMPDGKVTLPVGTRLTIPVTRLHNDPRYYTEPQRFNPDRFGPEMKEPRHKFAYLPFGEGPRICIGMRFGLLQVKVALVSILSQFEIRPKPGIPYPPVLSSKYFTTSFEHGATVLLTTRAKRAKL